MLLGVLLGVPLCRDGSVHFLRRVMMDVRKVVALHLQVTACGLHRFSEQLNRL